jgi:hypothetical protein
VVQLLISQDEVLEHPALFGPDGVGASGTLSSPSFGNPSELMHTFLLQELDLDSINVDFRKRLTGRSGSAFFLLLLHRTAPTPCVQIDFMCRRLTSCVPTRWPSSFAEDSTDSRAWSVYEGVWQGLNDVAVKIYHEERAYQTECHNLWYCSHGAVLRGRW